MSAPEPSLAVHFVPAGTAITCCLAPLGKVTAAVLLEVHCLNNESSLTFAESQVVSS